MGRLSLSRTFRIVALVLAAALVLIRPVEAATAAQLNAEATAALQRLYAESPKAAALGRKSHAILVFPRIVKAGFLIGGQGGEGVLFVGGGRALITGSAQSPTVFRRAANPSATRCS